jgi:acyl-CoA synthetase (AMP-forming)/AMP-acid ligase II
MSFNFDTGVAEPAAFANAGRQLKVDSLLQQNVRNNPDEVALVSDEVSLTYAELDERANSLARGMVDRGLTPNDATVGVLSENRNEVIELFYAAAKAGFLLAPFNWRLERDELVHCVDLVEPDVVIVSENHDEGREWIDSHAETEPTFVALDDGEGPTYEDLLRVDQAGNQLPDHVDMEQGHLVVFTAATEGLPNGAVISQRAFVARGYQIALDDGLKPGDSFIGWSPLYHSAAIDIVFAASALGGTYYVVDGFDPGRLVAIFEERTIGWLFLMAPVISHMVEYLEEADVDAADLEPVRRVGGAADITPSESIERVTEFLGAPYQNEFGMTETGHIASASTIPVGEGTEGNLSKRESALVDVRIVDDDWNVLEPGNAGEIAVRGTTMFSGYIGESAENDNRFHRGWFRTGDVFIRNNDGSLDFLDRQKYLVKSGGENIYPAELENVLRENPAIQDACVIRIPDGQWGEVPKAYVEAEDAETVDADLVMDELDERIARYKLPHYVEVVDPGTLPRTDAGEADREAVEELPVSEAERVRE